MDFRSPEADDVVGALLELQVGAFAPGGHCVARHEGRVVFVRHALPGERVTARVTEGAPGDRYLRADAVDVLDPSPDRVQPPCPWAGPGRCGGCDLQHVRLERQRALKAEVVREQLSRLGGVPAGDLSDLVVEPLAGERDGLGWRTRVELAVDDDGRPGLHPHRSAAVLPVDRCVIAAPAVVGTGVLERRWPGERAVDVVAPSHGEPVVVPVPSGEAGAPSVTERVAAASLEATFEVPARGFWQVHPGAAATLVDAVIEAVRPVPGWLVLDLYAGAGLFAAALAEAVGADGRVLAVESHRPTVAAARENLAPWPGAVVVQGRVDDVLGVPRPRRRGPAEQRRTRPRRPHRHPLLPPRADAVVLDPPRAGAGREVVTALAELRPEVVGYLSCDPGALGRDTAYLAGLGYRLERLRAFDAFPMTQHVECLATFRR